ncbi:MAG TPA: ribose 5-phosphate isomerase A [Longimicrobiaceae bacterium]|nr:ribose 5-phosphate isomerase A [Longimicrobiaceae bacterium]
MQDREAEALKREAAVRAAGWIQDGMVLGLGTGSTVRYLLEEIGARIALGEWTRCVGVPTSEHTARRARELGIPLTTLAQHPRVDLTIDGADEVNPGLELIKGLGGALLREKIVATASERVIIVVDESKRVTRLGTRSPLPVEVDPFGAPIQVPFLEGLGAEVTLRRTASGDPVVTDGGNYLFDCHFPGGIPDPAALGTVLDGRPGIAENGLFLGFVDHVVVASAGGVDVLSRAREAAS